VPFGIYPLLSLAETEDNRDAISQAGAVALLLRLLLHDHPAVVEKAAGVIWNLSHEEAVQHSIRELGGLRILISLLSSDAHLIRFNVIGAFPFLTEQEENVKQCFELRVIEPLVAMLAGESNVLVLQNAAQTLGNMAEGRRDVQDYIRSARGLIGLADVIAKWTPHRASPDVAHQGWEWSNQQELLSKCCFAVWLVCQNNKLCQMAYFEAGRLGGLATLLHSSSDDTLLEMAAGAICALCENCTPVKEGFRECGGLESLILLLDHKNDSVKLNSAKALCHLSECDKNRDIIRQLGGLDKIVRLLSLA